MLFYCFFKCGGLLIGWCTNSYLTVSTRINGLYTNEWPTTKPIYHKSWFNLCNDCESEFVWLFAILAPAPCFSNWVQCSHSKTYLAFPFFLEFIRTILSRGFFYGTSKIATWPNACLKRSNPDNTEELTRKFICYNDCDIWI